MDSIELMYETGWADGLPVIPPTRERVQQFTDYLLPRSPDELIAEVPPLGGRATIERVAVNAVMAGARPEYLPVILAHAASGVSARSSSTTSFACYSVVNGPVRGEIGMSDGIGAMGPHNHANVAIGRAYNLLSMNLQGGSEPGDTIWAPSAIR